MWAERDKRKDGRILGESIDKKREPLLDKEEVIQEYL